MFVALIFWFQFYCGFSGSSMVDQWYLVFFNLMFSAFPQLVTGTLDKDVSARTLQALPQLYMNGQNSEVVSGGAFTARGGRGRRLELKRFKTWAFCQCTLEPSWLNTQRPDLTFAAAGRAGIVLLARVTESSVFDARGYRATFRPPLGMAPCPLAAP